MFIRVYHNQYGFSGLLYNKQNKVVNFIPISFKHKIDELNNLKGKEYLTLELTNYFLSTFENKKGVKFNKMIVLDYKIAEKK